MRKLVVIAAVALVACGSSSSNSSVTGTVAGSPFTATETVAMVVEPRTCSIPNVGPGGTSADLPITAVGVAFSSSAGTCNTLAGLSGGACPARADSRTVTVVIARLPLGSTNTPSIGPGEYQVGASQSDIQINLATGMGTVAFAQAQQVDGACSPSVHLPQTAATAGGVAPARTIRLTEVSASKVSGHVDITFDDGGRIQGDFSANVCGTTPDVCALTQSTAGLCAGGLTCS